MVIHEGLPLLGAEDHPMDVAAWLSRLGLEQYAELFRDNDIDGEILRVMTADDLKELGISSFGHRRRLLAAITALGASPLPTPGTPALAGGRPGAPPLVGEGRMGVVESRRPSELWFATDWPRPVSTAAGSQRHKTAG
jgi:hypothetical protein